MAGATPYDARFDPLTARAPAACSDYAPTYWVATAGAPPPDDGPIAQDIDADVAVIGAGFTGLACALFLAREHGVRATVLEANGVSWGCTSRNGGQGQLASGRLYRSQWIGRWGRDVALRMHAEISEGFDTFRKLVSEIECDARDEGHLLIAHRRKKMAFIRSESDVMNRVFGCRTEVLGRDAVHAAYAGDAECEGALFEPEGICVHPLKLAYGYLCKAREAGARVHTSSPVLEWTSRDGVHHLRTPGGTVRARAVAVATGAYAPPTLHRALRGRIFPVLSNSVVTRVLTPAELEACKLRSGAALTDTRTLRFYYRKLPDGRLQIGSRSAVTGADAENPVHLRRLTAGLARKFPAIAGVPLEYSWWGWVDLSHDMMPRITQPEPQHAVYYALGYGGNGVSYSAQAGKRMAERIVGRGGDWDLPIFSSPLPPHTLAPFRRLGQRMLYVWYNLRDEVL